MSENENGSKFSLNKFSFYVVASIAILYIVTMILSLVHVGLKVVSILQSVAAACTIIIAAILAWRYVHGKTTIWKVFYFVCMALVIVGVLVPLLV